MKRITTSLVLSLSLSLLASHPANAWEMKKGPLMTKWAADVKADAVLPDYPRPQLTRTDWVNLNGVWEYQPGKQGDATPVRTKGSLYISRIDKPRKIRQRDLRRQ